MIKGKPFVKWAGGKRQIIDKLKFYAPNEFNTYYEPFVGGASIIAKEIRDDYMDLLDKKYPGYGFAKNKGYPTKAHMVALKELGVLPIHRKTYSPVTKEFV